MNIAFWDAIDMGMIGGTTTYVNTLKRALFEAGHHVTHFRYNKTPKGTDILRVPDNTRDASIILSAYDVILLPDACFYSEDMAVRFTDETPAYMQVLDGLKSPVIGIIHAALLQGNADVRTVDVLQHPAMTSIVAHDTRDLRGVEFDGKNVHEEHYLPYYPFPEDARQNLITDFERGCFMTSRLARNKGHAPLLLLAGNGFVDCNIDVIGNSFMGGMTTPAQTQWKKMIENFDCTPVEPKAGGPAKGEAWTVRTTGGKFIRYLGGYNHQTEPYERINKLVHVNLTSTFTMGHLEYVTLEAIDAGRVAVVHEELVDKQDYDMSYLIAVNGRNYGNTAYGINHALNLDLRDFKAWREHMMDKHDPVKYVNRILDTV